MIASNLENKRAAIFCQTLGANGRPARFTFLPLNSHVFAPACPTGIDAGTEECDRANRFAHVGRTDSPICNALNVFAA
jgi:hypothetical protein